MPKSKTLKLLPRVHKTEAFLFDGTTGPISIALVGCGGNGAQMLSKLARLDYALRECGKPHGLQVTAFDPDVVSRANVGRQLFSPSDVGLHKTTVLVNRINAFYGCQWNALPMRYPGFVQSLMGPGTMSQPDILISCVDTARARREFARMMDVPKRMAPRYWLDLGNKRAEGQVILGEPMWGLNAINRGRAGAVPSAAFEDGVDAARAALREQAEARRLPIVTEVFPDLMNSKLPEDDAPSCSLADALDKQSLFVNDGVTSFAAQLLDDLLRRGEIAYHGAFINLETGRVNPLPVPHVSVDKCARAKKAVAA